VRGRVWVGYTVGALGRDLPRSGGLLLGARQLGRGRLGGGGAARIVQTAFERHECSCLVLLLLVQVLIIIMHCWGLLVKLAGLVKRRYHHRRR
jgi:hypothetical protein